MKFFLAFFYILGLAFALCSLLGGGFMQSAGIEAAIFDAYVEAHPDVEAPEESAALASQVLMSTYWPSILMGIFFFAYFGICACLQVGSAKAVDLIGWGFLLLCSALSIYSGTRTLGFEDLSRFFATLQIIGGALFIVVAGIGVFSSVVKGQGSSTAASAAH